MEFKRARLLVEKAFEEEDKRDLWEMWLSQYPWMNKENFVSFNDFYIRVTNPMSETPTEDIIDMVENIRKKVRERGDI